VATDEGSAQNSRAPRKNNTAIKGLTPARSQSGSVDWLVFLFDLDRMAFSVSPGMVRPCPARAFKFC
jgi:hypothetical protein